MIMAGSCGMIGLAGVVHDTQTGLSLDHTNASKAAGKLLGDMLQNRLPFRRNSKAQLIVVAVAEGPLPT